MSDMFQQYDQTSWISEKQAELKHISSTFNRTVSHLQNES